MAAQLTQLQYLETIMDIDCDSMEPAVSISVGEALGHKPHSATSNQLLINEQISVPENRQMFLDTVKEMQDKGWEEICDRLTAQVWAKNIGNLQDRVLVQTSPRFAYETDKVLEHARRLAKNLEAVGISKDRFTVKIPVTGPAMNAVPILKKEGIRALGTSLFGLPQALAASQAGCLYISPYFNEVRAHAEAALWPDSDDPALKHTMSARMIHILEAYKRLYDQTGEEQPMVKSASFISAPEAMACGEMGCHQATISEQVLAELAKIPYTGKLATTPKRAHPYKDFPGTPARLAGLSKIDPLAPANWDGKLASDKIDYLANNGAELDKANNADLVVKQRLFEALELFKGGEQRTKEAIEAAVADLKKA